MGFGFIFIFTIAFLASFAAILAADPSVLRIVGEYKSRAVYGHCYLTATSADLLACIDISSGLLSWRFPIDENQVRNGKKVVAGDKVAFVLSYSTDYKGADIYAVSVKDGSLLWSLPLSSGEFIGDAVDLTYSRSENALFVLLHNAIHKINTSGPEPAVSTMVLSDSVLAGLKLLHLIDSVGDNPAAKRGVAVGCMRGNDNKCKDSAVLQLNTQSGDAVEITKIKSSSSGSNIYASENSVYRIDVAHETASTLSVTLEQTTYNGSQQRSAVDIDLSSLLGSDHLVHKIETDFYRLESTPIVHLRVSVQRHKAQPVTFHFVLASLGESKLSAIYLPHSIEEKVLITFDAIASSAHSIRKLQIYTNDISTTNDASFLDGKIRVVGGNQHNLKEDSMVGLLKDSEKVVIAEGGSRITAFQMSTSQPQAIWTRQEAIAQLQQAILLPGLTMKTSSSFFAAVDSICLQSQIAVVKPLCAVFDRTRSFFDIIETAFQRILPTRVPHHRHSNRQGGNSLTEGQDHVVAISYVQNAQDLAAHPVPLHELNLQVHSLVFPHDLSTLRALNGGSAEKSVLICSRRLVASQKVGRDAILVRSVRLLVVPATETEVDGSVTVRVVADVVHGGVLSWTTSFSLEEDMRLKNGDDYVSVLSTASSSSVSTTKTLLPTEEWEVPGNVVAVMPTHIITEQQEQLTKETSISILPLPAKNHDQQGKKKIAAQFVHTISPQTGEINIYESESARKVASVLFDPTVESIVDVAFPLADDLIYSRVAILGDDNILVKYLNPNLIAVCTATTAGAAESNSSSTSSVPQVFINLVDIVSGNILQRVLLDSAATPVRAHLMENFVLVSYWNPVVKRAEVITMGLYDGVIGKTDYLPFTAKPNVGTREHDEKATAASVSADKEDEDKAILLRSSFLTSIPLVMQRTYLMPRKVMDITHTLSRHGLTNKNILLTLESGDVYSLDFRFLHPRRPVSDPTAAEREEGLMRYGPIFPMIPQMLVTSEQALRPIGRYPTQTLSAPSYLESEALVFIYGRFNDVLFTSVTPSQGFDTLSANFNYTALVGLITLLFVGVMVMRRMHRKSTLKRMWP